MTNIIRFPVIPRPEAFSTYDPASINFAAQVRHGVVSHEEISRRHESPGFFEWFSWMGLKLWRMNFVSGEKNV